MIVHGFPFSVTLVSEIMTFLSAVHSSALSHVGQCQLHASSVACNVHSSGDNIFSVV